MVYLISLCELGWLPILLSWLLPFLLGWLFGSMFRRGDDGDTIIHDHSDELNKLKIQLDDCLSEKSRLKADLRASSGISAAAGISSTADSGSTMLSYIPSTAYAGLKNTNLQIIEGVGPKMESLLHGWNYNTWSELADADASVIKGKLEDTDPKYRIIDPSTWPNQAKMATDAKWDELIQYQKSLTAGKDDRLDSDTNSKLETVLIKLGLLKKFDLNDLKAIEGIGPKIEGLLNDAGINTWRELANTAVNKLQSILDDAGDRFSLADPGTWPKQAELAADGRWKELFEYQDFLNGGREK